MIIRQGRCIGIKTLSSWFDYSALESGRKTLRLHAGTRRALAPLIRILSITYRGADVLFELLTGLCKRSKVVLNSWLQETVIDDSRGSRGVELEVDVKNIFWVVELCRVHLILLLARKVAPSTPSRAAILFLTILLRSL